LHFLTYNTDPQMAACAIAAAMCIGIVPLFGLTFILVSIYAFIFRLNFFIMQMVHLLVSPIQLILLIPFIKTGQLIFQIESKIPPVKELQFNYLLQNIDSLSLHVIRLLLAGTLVWLIFSILAGLPAYFILFNYFRRTGKQNQDVPQKVMLRS